MGANKDHLPLFFTLLWIKVGVPFLGATSSTAATITYVTLDPVNSTTAKIVTNVPTSATFNVNADPGSSLEGVNTNVTDSLSGLGNDTDQIETDQDENLTSMSETLNPASLVEKEPIRASWSGQKLKQTDASGTCIRFSIPYAAETLKVTNTLSGQTFEGNISLSVREDGVATVCDLERHQRYEVKLTMADNSTASEEMWTNQAVPAAPPKPSVEYVGVKTVELVVFPVAFDWEKGPFSGIDIRVMKANTDNAGGEDPVSQITQDGQASDLQKPELISRHAQPWVTRIKRRRRDNFAVRRLSDKNFVLRRRRSDKYVLLRRRRRYKYGVLRRRRRDNYVELGRRRGDRFAILRRQRSDNHGQRVQRGRRSDTYHSGFKRWRRYSDTTGLLRRHRSNIRGAVRRRRRDKYVVLRRRRSDIQGVPPGYNIALLKVNQETEFTVGDGSTAYNKPLEPDTEYIIYVGTVSTLLSRSTSAYSSVRVRTKIIHPPTVVSVLFILASIAVLFIYIFYLYWRKKAEEIERKGREEETMLMYLGADRKKIEEGDVDGVGRGVIGSKDAVEQFIQHNDPEVARSRRFTVR